MESAVINPRGFEFLIKFSGLEVTYPQVLLTPVTGEFGPVNRALNPCFGVIEALKRDFWSFLRVAPARLQSIK